MAPKEGRRLRGLLRRAVQRGARNLNDLAGRRANAPMADEAQVRFVDAEGNELAEQMVPTGMSILALAARLKIEIDHYCGGQCSCGTCRINVKNGADNLSSMGGMEEMVLGSASLKKGCRLACQARIQGPVEIQIPRWF